MSIFNKTREDLKNEIKEELKNEYAHQAEHYDADGALNLDAHREIESLVKARLGAAHVVMCAQMLDGTVLTYIPEEIGDKDLVYLIQMLQDLRNERLLE